MSTSREWAGGEGIPAGDLGVCELLPAFRTRYLPLENPYSFAALS